MHATTNKGNSRSFYREGVGGMPLNKKAAEHVLSRRARGRRTGDPLLGMTDSELDEWFKDLHERIIGPEQLLNQEALIDV